MYKGLIHDKRGMASDRKSAITSFINYPPSTKHRQPSYISKLYSYNNGSYKCLTKPKRPFLKPISLLWGLWGWQSLAILSLKIGLGTALLLGSTFLLSAQSVCSECEIQVPDSLLIDTFFIQDFPDGNFLTPYSGNISFRLPINTNEVLFLVPDLPGNIPFSSFKIKAMENLPAGLVWMSNQEEYDLPDERNGCIAICGRPLEFGLFEIDITITAGITILNQDATFTRTIFIAPPSSNNSGFSINNNIGCGTTTATFENNNPSDGIAGYSYFWDFGNGNTSQEEQPAEQLYDNPGFYPVQYQAIIDTVPPTLTEITVLHTNCDDFLGRPDLYFRLYDNVDTLVLESDAVENTEPPLSFTLSTPLTASNYRLEVWDDDQLLEFQDDSCGAFIFSPTLSDTLQTEDLTVWLTILRSADTIQVTDSVIVHPLPPPPSILGEDFFFCEGDTLQLASTYAENLIWLKDEVPIDGANDSLLAITAAGTYQSSFTSANGCTVFSEPILIRPTPLPSTPVFSHTENILSLSDTTILPPNYELQWLQEGNLLEDADTRICVSETGNYALQLKDIDTGCAALFEANITFDTPIDCTTSTSELTNLLDAISIYPNPASDKVVLAFSTSLPLQNVQLQLYNSLGQILFTKQYDRLLGEQQFSLNLSQQTKGMYWIVLQSEQGSSSWKVLKGN